MEFPYEIKKMQGDIIELLEKEKKPLSRTQIAEKLNEENVIKVSMTIARLLKHHEIKCIEIDRKQAMKFYKVQRRMRLYYI